MTIDYSQPEFYRFNQDSLLLIEWIRKSTLKADSILDLGAGCGIIGMELAQLLHPSHLYLVELQADFLPYLQQNARQFIPPQVKVEILNSSFSRLSCEHKFDLIVCNPPYYLPGRGERSADPRRALARSFLQDSWSLLLGCIQRSLASEGRAMLIIKKDEFVMRQLKQEALKHQLEAKLHDQGKLWIAELFTLNEN